MSPDTSVSGASRPKTRFTCCFPPMRSALQSCRGRSGMEVRFSIPESEIAAGMRLYLLRDLSVQVVVEAAPDEGEIPPELEKCEFCGVVSHIASPGSRDGLEAKVWVPESEMPGALPLHLLRDRALLVSIEVLEDEFQFADAKTKKCAERERQADSQTQQEAGAESTAPPPTPKRRARPGRIERGHSSL